MKQSRLSFVIALLLLLFFSLLFLPQAHASFGEEGPAQKLARGLAHVVSAPLYIPKQMIQTAMEAEPVYLAPWQGMTFGFGKGVFLMGRQWVSGFVDIFTFWNPSPPLFEPETLLLEI